MAFADYQLYEPGELGVDVELVEKLHARMLHALESGPLPSLQYALARNDKLIAARTLGDVSQCDVTQGVPALGPRYNIFSCTKPLVAAAIWQLLGEGELNLEQPVAHYLPEFAENGKGAVTVEHVLCHTSGFPNAPMNDPQWFSSATRREQMRQWHLDWEPGTRCVYHALSAHWVLAELIEAVKGVSFTHYIQDNIVKPLGLSALRLGVPEDEQGDIAPLQTVGEPPTPKEIEKVFGRAMEWPAFDDASALMFERSEVRALGIPGGGAISNAADVALFYQAMMHNAQSLWDERVLADAVGTVRVDFEDPMTGAPANRGLGVVIAGSGKYLPYRGMGQHVGPRAFGHQGIGGQAAWGDPDSGLSFCILTNGMDANPLRSARLCAAASNRAGACVPLS
ncbi:MAG: serine hydrolase domain-containing protein [Halioglobus sp.]